MVKDGSETELVPGGKALIPTDMPIVVIISRATRGLAEILAANFNETKRGLLIGMPTAGEVSLDTEYSLSNGAKMSIANRTAKTGQGADLNGRGVFPLICLSSIKTTGELEVMFMNLSRGDFEVKDFNSDVGMTREKMQKACPDLQSGADEDLLSAGVSARLLTDKGFYKKLVARN
jgi:hypothetical protein